MCTSLDFSSQYMMWCVWWVPFKNMDDRAIGLQTSMRRVLIDVWVSTRELGTYLIVHYAKHVMIKRHFTVQSTMCYIARVG